MIVQTLVDSKELEITITEDDYQQWFKDISDAKNQINYLNSLISNRQIKISGWEAFNKMKDINYETK